MADESNPGNVSQVLPNGETAPLTPEPDAKGERAVPGTSDKYEQRIEAENALDDRLGEIFDKNNPEGDQHEGAVKRTVEQPRAPDGKFTKAELDAAAAKTAGDKPQPTESQVPPVPLPRSWSPDEKEMWDSLPRQAQEKWAQRETEAHRTISTQGQTLAAFRPLGELLVQNKDVFAKHGAPPVEGIARLITVQRRLDQDPVGTVAAIAKLYQVPIQALVNALGVPRLGPDGRPLAPDPRDQEIARLQARLDQLNQRLDGRDQNEQSVQAAQKDAWQAQVDNDVREWSASRPYFEHVREAMAVLVENDLADDLDDAYDRAVNADPKLRELIRADKVKEDTTKQREEAAARAAAEKAEREKHTSEAKRSRSIQMNNSHRSTTSAKPSGKWNDSSYLERLYDKVASN